MLYYIHQTPVAVEQKYNGGGGWHERLQSSRLSVRSIHVRRAKIGGGGGGGD